jgi:transposase
MAHRRGIDREQAALFPVMLDEAVPRDALVRVVDEWIGTLSMEALGFAKARPQVRGAPPYDPADLLKLYVWGYLNGVTSSRVLERESHRNVECMWLTGNLKPDHKTISEFRRTNKQALVAVCAAFVDFARCQKLVAATVAIDGSKIRASASRKAVIGQRQLAEQARRNAQEIERYLAILDEQDERESREHHPSSQDVRRALRELQAQREAIRSQVEQVAASGSSTLVTSEPEAKVMPSLNHAPGYNLQAAVDTQSHLVVAHEVVNTPSDRRQLTPMALAAKQALGELKAVVADAGYSNAEQIATVQKQGIQTFVAEQRSGNSREGGTLYERGDFQYDVQSDSFTCPAGKTLRRHKVHQVGKQVIYMARANDCGACPNKGQCTTGRQRSVSRHLYEEALQANQQNLQHHPHMMQVRRETVEHVFGTIKHWMPQLRLRLRGLSGAAAELSLAVLAYNIKRVFNLKGSAWMQQAVQG